MQWLFSYWSTCTSSCWALLLGLVAVSVADNYFSKCDITENFVSEFVSATFRSLEPGYSCETNSTGSKDREVHVISVRLPAPNDKERMSSNDKQRLTSVHVGIHSRKNADFNDIEGVDFKEENRPLLIVLYSTSPVSWALEMDGVYSQKKHLFITSDDSEIRFLTKRTKQMAKDSRRQMPHNSSDIYQWAKDKFRSVTSYNEIANDNIKFYVGRDARASAECDVTKLTPSMRVFSFHEVSQPISGCTAKNRHNAISFAKPTYVIELISPPAPSPGMVGVDLEVLAYYGEEENPLALDNREFSLVIKSPPNVKWSLHSKNIPGWVEIVADAEVVRNGIRFSNAAYRPEMISATGRKLIDWSQEFLAPVHLYAGVRAANTIKLWVPPKNHKKSQLPDVKPNSNKMERNGSVKVGRNRLQNAIKVTCTDQYMEVAVSKKFMQTIKKDLSRVSLNDSSCGQTGENEHSILLKTRLTGCGTTSVRKDDKLVFTNTLIIQVPPGITSTILVEELGSGFMDDEHGSGLGDGGFTDDEDLYGRKTIKQDVECKVQMIIKPPQPTKSQCDLTLYREATLAVPVLDYPVHIVKDSTVYAMARVGAGYSILPDACWFSNSKDPNDREAQISYVVNSCQELTQSAAYSEPLMGSKIQDIKFNLQLSDYFHGYPLYLHCQFYTCRKENDTSHTNCFINYRNRCRQNEPNAKERTGPNCGPLSLGPIHLENINMNMNIPSVSQWPTGGRVPKKESKPHDDTNYNQQQKIIIEGLDSATVVGIAFAAFAIGIFLTGALWFIHSHTGDVACCPIKQGVTTRRQPEVAGDMTPNSSSPMTA
ncbi:transforming growth factor beta receptor type 3-like [Physella acuta]|uniref:transforming growth factor beta receptor type 3-like n=1 Tax=Physella acuta TaxID=109671 RepID=UPI0027DB7CAE|nr:transforming growth factor beta receptor type 3-like [Physella acuta]